MYKIPIVNTFNIPFRCANYVMEQIMKCLFVDNFNSNYMVWKCFICFCLTWVKIYKNNWSKLLPLMTNAEPTRMGGYLWLPRNTSYLLFKHLVLTIFCFSNFHLFDYKWSFSFFALFFCVITLYLLYF